MKKNYKLILFFLLTSFAITAQTIKVPPNLDGTTAFPFTDLTDFINKDTLANGNQKNTVYQLERGGLYFFSSTARWKSDVTLEATGPVANGRPVISRRNKAGGATLATMYRGVGSLTLDGLYIVAGDNGPAASAYDTSPFIGGGKGKTYKVLNCVYEKSRQSVFNIGAGVDSVKLFLEGNHLYNLGDYKVLQGNGRIVDPRNSRSDSIIIRNNVVHNLLDRAYIGFRQSAMNYFEMTNNTIFNHVGRHGFVQLGNVTKSAVIKNNLFINPSIIGTDTSFADEQFAPFVKKENFLFTLSDTGNVNTKIVMTNNNISYSADVLSNYNTAARNKKPRIFSPSFASKIDTTKAFFTETIELNNVPSRAPLIKYVNDVNVTTIAIKENIMVEDILFKGQPGYESVTNFFDFTKFDGCYSKTSKSYTAASDGKALGARWPCGEKLTNTTPELVYNPNIKIEAFPNPASTSTTFRFNLPGSGNIKLELFDMQGRQVTKIHEGVMNEGVQEFTWNDINSVNAGVYFASIQTQFGRMITKVVLTK
jgi:hypothetical protein